MPTSWSISARIVQRCATPKILNRSRYEYRSQSFVHSGGYICLYITHTSIRKPTSQWPTFFLYYRAITTSSRRNAVPKLHHKATPGYIHFSSHTHTCVTHPRHTPPSLIAVAISRREIAKHFQSKQRVTKTRQQNTSTKHVNTATRHNITPTHQKNCAPSPAINNSLSYGYRAIMAYRATKQ